MIQNNKQQIRFIFQLYFLHHFPSNNFFLAFLLLFGNFRLMICCFYYSCIIWWHSPSSAPPLSCLLNKTLLQRWIAKIADGFGHLPWDTNTLCSLWLWSFDKCTVYPSMSIQYKVRWQVSQRASEGTAWNLINCLEWLYFQELNLG